MRSIAFRLAAFSGLWLALGLGAAGWFVSDTMTRSIADAFEARLGALLDAAVAGAAIDEDGAPVMERPPGLPEFERPFSGAYWQITTPDGRIATSRSLWDERLPGGPAPGSLAPEDPAPGGPTLGGAIALREAKGPRGATLRIAERVVVPAGATLPVTVAAALDRGPLDRETARLGRVIVTLFAVLGAGLAAALVLQLLAGLAPLRRARRALVRVREGKQDRLGLDVPSEIAPLVAEIDALIAQNRATVERARAHLGNLAHALKTPVAVLWNALEAPTPDIATARAEAARLGHLVQHHLARARAAGTVAEAPVPLRAAAEEIAAALGRLFAGRGLAITVTGGATLRARIDRQDLAELLGNLMENACQWADTRVTVTLARGEGASVTITVEDDGPGLTGDEAAAVTGRFVRLDEAAPGTGLGLAIATDLASLHGGTLSLGRAASGGLSARVTLPGG